MIAREHVARYAGMLRRDFHPWDCDNRELIAEWHAEYGDYVVVPARVS